MKKTEFVLDYEAARPTQEQIEACKRDLEAARTPELDAASAAVAEAMEKAGLTPREVLIKMAELRNLRAQFEAWKNQQPKGNK